MNGANLRKRAVAAPPGQFIEAITLRQEEWTAVRAKFDPLPGVISMADKRVAGRDPGFARAVLGGRKQGTAETLENVGPTTTSSDQSAPAGCSTRSSSSSPGHLVAP